ncbi:MAG TPA: DUF1566 domain-containing protein, partial [bacterium]|nr:DUF1566 domain-containing protein [bacterium]
CTMGKCIIEQDSKMYCGCNVDDDCVAGYYCAPDGFCSNQRCSLFNTEITLFEGGCDTEGKCGGIGSLVCVSDKDCDAHKSKITCESGKCKYTSGATSTQGGNCTIKADCLVCSGNNFLNYNDNAVNINQSEIEYKSTANGKVGVLVTESKCRTCETDCPTTTLKWQRIISESCSGDQCSNEDYLLNEVFADPVAASSWTDVSASDPDFVQKTGDYQVFSVQKDKIYRWVICSDDFDTQLTLFRGEASSDSCGTFLEYSDDAAVEMCSTGIGSIIEWKSDFNGKVTLLINEYQCRQCAKSSSTMDPYGHCSDKEFDLKWQKYDCNVCSYNKEINLNSGSVSNFAPSASQQFILTNVKKGNAYKFALNKSDAILTLRKGNTQNDCTGELIEQGSGSLSFVSTFNGSATLVVSGKNCTALSGSTKLTVKVEYDASARFIKPYLDNSWEAIGTSADHDWECKDKNGDKTFTCCEWTGVSKDNNTGLLIYDPKKDFADWESARDYCNGLNYPVIPSQTYKYCEEKLGEFDYVVCPGKDTFVCRDCADKCLSDCSSGCDQTGCSEACKNCTIEQKAGHQKCVANECYERIGVGLGTEGCHTDPDRVIYPESCMKKECDEIEKCGTGTGYCEVKTGAHIYDLKTGNYGGNAGKSISGWTLPTINQLYSIVDFGLFDPATSYDITGSYNMSMPWYWSSTSVADSAQYAWTVDMKEGLSYRAPKTGGSSLKVICVMGASVVGEFYHFFPAKHRLFEGWACDTRHPAEQIEIYFAIYDKNLANISTADTVDLPGNESIKVFSYGLTDIIPDPSDTSYGDINHNCANTAGTKPHVFSLDLNSATDALAVKIKSAISSTEVNYVTVYAKNHVTGAVPVTTTVIPPAQEYFVLNDSCGDSFKTGTEECDDGNTVIENCDYNNDCQTCGKLCTFVQGNIRKCGDSKIQKSNCGSLTEPDCYVVEGANEACDCGQNIFTISGGICDKDRGDSLTCPGYSYAGPGYTCELCNGCQITTKGLSYCGDNITNSDWGEECDNGSAGNNDSSQCLEDCTLATCGDGLTCSSCTPQEVCDAGGNNGEQYNNCNSGCSGYLTCGDGVIQRDDCPGAVNYGDSGTYNGKVCVKVQGANEKCDEGSVNNGDYRLDYDPADPGCNATCSGVAPYCGD